jgi:acetyl esterase/lipase
MILALLLALQTVEKDLKYADAHEKQKLDLYVPRGDGPFPVLLWVHGGAWKMGDRSMFAHVGNAFAKRGILTAAMSYRLTKHPEQIQDVAAAVAWLKKNAKDRRGDPDRLFVLGQSAGGHLTALLGLNDKYLKEVDLQPSDIAGYIPISGVYGDGIRVFPDVFPKETLDDAQPLKFAKKDAPPFLILWGDGDPLNIRAGSRKLAQELGATSAEMKDRTHITIVTKIGSDGDELTETVAKFVLGK